MCVQSRYDFEAPAVPFASQLAEFALLPLEYHVDVMQQEYFTRGRLLRALCSRSPSRPAVARDFRAHAYRFLNISTLWGETKGTLKSAVVTSILGTIQWYPRDKINRLKVSCKTAVSCKAQTNRVKTMSIDRKRRTCRLSLKFWKRLLLN